LWKFTLREIRHRHRVPIAAYTGIACRRCSGGRRRSVGVRFFTIFFAAPDRSPSPPSTTPVLALFAVRPPDYLSLKKSANVFYTTIVSGRENHEHTLKKKTQDHQRRRSPGVSSPWCGVAAAAAASRWVRRITKTPPEEWTSSWREYDNCQELAIITIEIMK